MCRLEVYEDAQAFRRDRFRLWTSPRSWLAVMRKPPRPEDVRKSLLILSLSPDEITHARDVNKRANAILSGGVHPDVGGSNDEAQAINAARDFVHAWLKAGRFDLGDISADRESMERARRAEAA